NGNPFFNPNKGYEACYLGDNRVSMGIPLRHNLTGLDLITCFDAQLSTVGQFIPLALTAMTVGNRQSRRTGNHNQVTVRLLNGLQVVQTHGTAMLHMDAIHGRRPGSRTTDVERTHGQLGTGLTDRLSSNNTDRLTDVHQVTTGQIAAVALGAHSMAGITGTSGAHDDLVDPRLLNQLYQCLIQQGAGSQQYSLIITRCVDVTCSHTSQHSVTQRYNNITTFDQRSDQDALIGTTVNFGDNQVLSHVHQTTGQVTGVGGFQSRIRQTFSRTVSRNKVLKYVQAFAEVRSDRRFNNGTVGLSHQSPHPSELTDLGRGAPSAGVSHHITGVEGILQDFFTLFVDNLFLTQRFHHRLAHLLVGTGPDIDDL